MKQGVLEVSVDIFLDKVGTEGGHFLVGEYRGSGVSVVEYLDKESGKKESYLKVVHSVEVRGAPGLETVHLQELTDRSITTPEQYKNQCWLVPGMRVLVVPRRVEIDKGIKKFTCTSGDIQLLAANGHGEKVSKR